jgi:hypothetical protein
MGVVTPQRLLEHAAVVIFQAFHFDENQPFPVHVRRTFELAEAVSHLSWPCISTAVDEGFASRDNFVMFSH